MADFHNSEWDDDQSENVEKDSIDMLAGSDDELFLEVADCGEPGGSCGKCGRKYKRTVHLKRHIERCNGEKARKKISLPAKKDDDKMKCRQLICIINLSLD